MKNVFVWCKKVQLLSFTTVLHFALSQQTTSDGCFTRYDNMKVQCTKPFQSRTGLSEQLCKDLCYQNSPQCQGVQYETNSMQCDLYNTMPTGRKKRDQQYVGPKNYGNNGGQQPYVPTPQPYKPKPYIVTPQPYVVVTPQPYKPVYPKQYPTGGQQTHNPNGQTYPTGGGTYQKPGGCGGGYGASVTNVGGYTYYKPIGQTTGCCSTCTLIGGESTLLPVTSPPVTTQPVLPPQATCDAGQVVRYLEVKGYQLSVNADQQFPATTEQECTQACTNNKLPNGNFAACQSADFNAQSSQCSIILNASPPAGTASLTQNSNVNHFEKVCLDSVTGQVCPGPIIKAPQKLLVGYAEAVVVANSFAECLQNCVNAQTRFGFKCLSGEFYTSEGTENCILNSESATTQPSLYTEENKDKVDYFEPGCVTTIRNKRDLNDMKLPRRRNVIWVNIEDWGSWTRCDSVSNNHKRFRQCSSFNPNKCSKDAYKCDPKNRAAEWGAINDEELPPEATMPPSSSQLFINTEMNRELFSSTTTSPHDEILFSTQQHDVLHVKESPLPTRPHHSLTPNLNQLIKDNPVNADVKNVNDQAANENKTNPPHYCEPVIKLDGSLDCKHGFRTLLNGRKQPCKPQMVDNSC